MTYAPQEETHCETCEACEAAYHPEDLTEDSAGRKVCDHCLEFVAQLGDILNS
jgi:hypothetical protein